MRYQAYGQGVGFSDPEESPPTHQQTTESRRLVWSTMLTRRSQRLPAQGIGPSVAKSLICRQAEYEKAESDKRYESPG